MNTQDMLHVAGEFIELARRAGRSLLPFERQAIANARSQAKAEGMSPMMIYTIEAQGSQVIRRGMSSFGDFQ